MVKINYELNRTIQRMKANHATPEEVLLTILFFEEE